MAGSRSERHQPLPAPEWGWTPLDHHGVPWPSSLAVLPGGWLQGLAFATTGGSLLALAVALPRDRRSVLLASCGAGLVAEAFPLDVPEGDPGALSSWTHSWHAAVHTGGFPLAGLAGVAAILASRRRADVATAVVLVAAAGVGGTPGWYAFVGGFFSWVSRLARRVADRRTHRGHGIHSTGRGAVADHLDTSARARQTS